MWVRILRAYLYKGVQVVTLFPILLPGSFHILESNVQCGKQILSEIALVQAGYSLLFQNCTNLDFFILTKVNETENRFYLKNGSKKAQSLLIQIIMVIFFGGENTILSEQTENILSYQWLFLIRIRLSLLLPNAVKVKNLCVHYMILCVQNYKLTFNTYMLTTQQVCAILCINVDLSTSKIIQRT